MNKIKNISMFVVLLAIIFFQSNCSDPDDNKELTKAEMIALGDYIVSTGGCDDCHTPKIFTENGPEFDMTRRFAGFPEGESLPALDPKVVSQGNWVATEKHTAAWVGTWGISYASNLTPDYGTGIGALSEEMFIKTLREGKYMGVGRPLLPPMPWQVIGKKTDKDLKAIYAYLQSVKPIVNRVPQPTTPDKLAETLSGK